MKSSKHKADISIDETIALLKKTSLPTIVVEGADDMIVYRHMEESLSAFGVSVLPVGGRKNVLEIFSRRGELPNSVKITFIADQDIWINIGIPPEYHHDSLVFTGGYSIENDIYTDGELWKLLRRDEVTKFDKEVSAFLCWYALALSRHLQNASEVIKFHPNHVLDPDHHTGLLSLQTGELYPDKLHEELSNDYQKTLRGKSLMALLIRNTSYSGREPHHNSKALMEMVANRPGPLLETMYSRVKTLHASDRAETS
jgi:hypothetical protein